MYNVENINIYVAVGRSFNGYFGGIEAGNLCCGAIFCQEFELKMMGGRWMLFIEF